MLNTDKKQSIEQWESAKDQHTTVIDDAESDIQNAEIVLDGKLSDWL